MSRTKEVVRLAHRPGFAALHCPISGASRAFEQSDSAKRQRALTETQRRMFSRLIAAVTYGGIFWFHMLHAWLIWAGEISDLVEDDMLTCRLHLCNSSKLILFGSKKN